MCQSRLMDGEAVADRLTNTCEAEQREQREAMERSLTRDEERIEVLDKMVMRLYEDASASGLIIGDTSIDISNAMSIPANPDAWGTDRNCYLAVNSIPVWSIYFSVRPAKPTHRSSRKPLSGTS